MKSVITILTTCVLSVLTGCEKRAEVDNLIKREKELLAAGKVLLTVDFQKGQTLRYKFISSRDIELDWNPGGKPSPSGKPKIDKSSESMEMVVAYTPTEVNPFGLTTIKATCESVQTRRSKGQQKDAVQNLTNKTFTFTVAPNGKIDDYSQIAQLIKEIGNKAFLPDTSRGRIKELDMIGDFSATQWFLWDPVSSIEIATEGVSVGQTWKSKLPVTGPMVMREARDVTYTLEKAQPSPKGRLVVISSSYTPAESVPNSWPPMPYSGRFNMRGTFGFLRGYKMLNLQGQGKEVFNIDTGRTEHYSQQYQVKIQAFIPFGIDVRPQITMKQNFKMQLLED